MLRSVRKLFVPLVAAVAVLGLIMVVSTPGVEAEVAEPTLPQPVDELKAPAVKPKEVPIVLGGNDYIVSFPNGNLPQIAGNNTFIAVVYELISRVYLRSATSNGFGFVVPLDATNPGNEPKVAFKPGTNLVHIVWVGSNGRFIRHKSCTLSDPLPTCSALHTIVSDNTAPFSLGSPDVVVDKNGVVHVVWQNGDVNVNQIFSARSTNDGATWSGPTSAGAVSSTLDAAPALTTAGDFLHLAFVSRPSTSIWRLNYRRSPIAGAYNWASATKNYDSSLTANYGQIFNPTIAAVGTKVFVAWDMKKNSVLDKFGLIGALNTNSGASGNWPAVPSHINSNQPASNNDPNNERLSQEDDVPTTENTLRPSVGVSGNDFVAVWDQSPEPECQFGEPPETNGSPEIFYAATQGNGWAQVGILANNQFDAHVDPDVVINSAGTHVVFMKTVDPDLVNCQEGANGLSIYVVGYRGPWGKDSNKGAQIRLPLIRK